jgi:hypothetical protein
MAEISAGTPVAAVAQLLHVWDCVDLADRVEGAELRWWEEPDEQLAVLGEHFVRSYPLTYAEMVIAPQHFEDLSDGALETIGRAVDVSLGGINGWKIVAGDWPDDESAEAPAGVPPRPEDWHGMHFRSQTELRVAQALDRANVMFCGNPRARLGLTADTRENREPDFLVLSRGKVGVLEVDGPSHHGKAADDHDRDRLFRRHGVRVVEHFDFERCYTVPDVVVSEFLRLLDLNG